MNGEEYIQKLVEINESGSSPICWFHSYKEDCVYKVDFNTLVVEKFTLGNQDFEHDLKNWVSLCFEELKLLDFENDSVWIYEDLRKEIKEKMLDYYVACRNNVSDANKEYKKATDLELFLKGKFKSY